MRRKGFPESYDLRRMVQFLADVKAGKPEVAAPVYSHLAYDILPGEWQVVKQPDIVIFEGLIRGEFYTSSAISMLLILVVMIVQYVVFRLLGDKALF